LWGGNSEKYSEKYSEKGSKTDVQSKPTLFCSLKCCVQRPFFMKNQKLELVWIYGVSVFE